jgi:hypothetical protein
MLAGKISRLKYFPNCFWNSVPKSVWKLASDWKRILRRGRRQVVDLNVLQIGAELKRGWYQALNNN